MVKLKFSSAIDFYLYFAHIQHLLKVEEMKHLQSTLKITSHLQETITKSGFSWCEICCSQALSFTASSIQSSRGEWRGALLSSPLCWCEREWRCLFACLVLLLTLAFWSPGVVTWSARGRARTLASDARRDLCWHELVQSSLEFKSELVCRRGHFLP